MTLKFPGLIDPHVHVREPGGTHKEDWDSCTSAALAGGFTTILAMPNTRPPVTDETTLQVALDAANNKARCNYAQFLGAGPENINVLGKLAPQTAGLKMYLDQTYGPLRLDDMTLWMEHFKHWPMHFPIVTHSEGRTLAAVILMSAIYKRPVHLAHVSLREEILLIKVAKEKGISVTCEVTPHHMFLTNEDIPSIGSGRSEVRPRLASPTDQKALWDNLNVIDVFATDHAPHTLEEKDGENPPPGFPGLETTMPLFFTAVHEGRLRLEDIHKRMIVNPKNIFLVPDQADTYTEIDPDLSWEIRAADLYTRCKWTPFEQRKVWGKVVRVVLRGREVYRNGNVLAKPGDGKNIRSMNFNH